MTTPLLSVVMAVYNAAPFLCEAVESILTQSAAAFEFIIINDGSTDDSASLLELYRRRDSRVHIYSQDNCGLIRSLNRGCELARGKYIARMDADDISLPTRFAEQLEFLEAHPHVALLGGAAEFIDKRGAVLKVVHPPTGDGQIRAALPDASVFLHPTTMFRRSVFASLGGYRHVTHAEDYDLWLRFADCSSLANLHTVVLRYRLHAEQVSVRWCREQALGASVAKAAALARQRGEADPLISSPELTPTLLAALGVTEANQQTELARTCLSAVRNMSAVGEYALALKTLEGLPLTQFMRADKWVIAELHLQAARLNWRHRRLWRSMLTAGQGILARPLVLGRPVARLLGIGGG
jgi:GT2 family glycosyltransferase